MTTRTTNEFDAVASSYDEQLHRGVSLSGERKEYFAQKRVAWLKNRLRGHLHELDSIMDYGCGTGTSIPYLCAAFHPQSVLGIDVSAASLQVARRVDESVPVSFMRPDEYSPHGRVRLVFSNGTFHHIPPGERLAVVKYLRRAVAPGGWIAIWENNPWNPATRLVMKRIPFDRDADPVAAPELVQLLRTGGCVVRNVEFFFIFPRLLRIFRWMEAWLCRLPLGAQYMVLAQVPIEKSRTGG